MSQQAKYLTKHGWVCVSTQKRGMFLIKRWSKRGVTFSQESAYNMERMCDPNNERKGERK